MWFTIALPSLSLSLSLSLSVSLSLSLSLLAPKLSMRDVSSERKQKKKTQSENRKAFES